jgi:hypothetical protein
MNCRIAAVAAYLDSNFGAPCFKATASFLQGRGADSLARAPAGYLESTQNTILVLLFLVADFAIVVQSSNPLMILQASGASLPRAQAVVVMATCPTGVQLPVLALLLLLSGVRRCAC